MRFVCTLWILRVAPGVPHSALHDPVLELLVDVVLHAPEAALRQR